MATNITTDNLLGQFLTLINTNAAGVADVDDLLIYKYSGGTLQRITAQLLRSYLMGGINSSLGGYATQSWVQTQLLSYVGLTAFQTLQATVNSMMTAVNGVINGQWYGTQAAYDEIENPSDSVTYYIYED